MKIRLLATVLVSILAVVIIFPLVVGCSSQTTTPAAPVVTPTQTSAPSSTAPPSSSVTAKPTSPTSTTASTTTAVTTAPSPTSAVNLGGLLKLSTSYGPSNVGVPWQAKTPFDPIFERPAIERLFGFNSNGSGEVIPQLAATWQWSSDFKTLTIALRQGVKFHDGTDFNAEAAKYCLDQFRTSGLSTIKSVTSVDVVDNYTVRLNLNTIDPALLKNLGNVAGEMVSPTAMKANLADALTHPVGTGPFKFDSFSRDTFLKYTKFDGYWQKGRPYVNAIQWDFVADPVTAVVNLKAGGTDGLLRISLSDLDTLTQNGFIMNSTYGSVTGMVSDSAHSDSPFSNLKVRQAVSYAMDKPALAKLMGAGVYVPDEQLAYPASPSFNPSIVGYPYDPQKARQLLTEAGYPNGFTTSITYNTSGDNTKQFTAVQSYLQAVGIKATLNPLLSAPLMQVQTTGWKNGLVLYNFAAGVADDTGTVMAAYLSSKGTYYPSTTVYIPSDYDSKLGQANAEGDVTKRNAMLQDLQKMVSDQCLVIPFFVTKTVTAVSPKVHDLDITKYVLNAWLPENAWLGK
jgi:peptide/nickel transport system substrate-binding protein